MRISRLLSGALAALAIWASPAPAAQAVGTPDPAPHALRLDPATRRGVLANGLRYVVTQTPGAAGVSLRLGFDVGSYEEDASELGVAHFIEHMAFNGTRNFAEDRLETIFAPLGVGFGRDHNAHTGLFETTYELDLPDAGPQAVDAGFRWLRDVADGMLFEPGAVARERGVVLAEQEASDGVLASIGERVRAFQGGDLRSVARNPIGTLESLQAMTPQRLRAFHQRWYRPENAVVVVVGALPVEAAERRVAAAFKDWTASGPAPARAPRTASRLVRDLDVMVQAEPGAPMNLVVCRIRPGEPAAEDDAGRRVRVAGKLWRLLLQQRFATLAAQSHPPIYSASVTEEDVRDGIVVCVSATPLNGDWQLALTTVQGELRRFVEQSPTDDELDRGIEILRAGLPGADSRQGARRAGMVAAEILQNELMHSPLLSPAEALYRFDLSVDGLGPQDIRSAFVRDWSGAGPLIALAAPQAIAPAAVRAAWTKHQGEPVAGQALAGREEDALLETTATSVETETWPYAAANPGKVARREVIADPGFVRLTFRNGLVLNFKQSAIEKGVVRVRVNFGGGRRAVADADFYKALLGTLTFKEGGLGKVSYERLLALNGQDIDLQMTLTDTSFALTSAAPAAALGGELQILAAYMRDPAFSDSIDAKLPTAVDALERLYRSTPSAMVAQALEQGVAPGSPRVLPSRAILKTATSEEFRRVLRPALTEAPIELTLVGDLDEAAAIRHVAASFGALPPRRNPPPAVAAPWVLRFPDAPVAPIRVVHGGVSGQAAVGVYWPLYVATFQRRREEYALQLVAEALELQLLRRIREALGKTYSPMAGTVMPDDLDQGYLYALLETHPRDVDQVVDEVRAVAANLARGDISAEVLEAVRRPLLTQLDAGRPTNGWWLTVLAGSARDPRRIADISGGREMIAGVTLDEVKAAAARWLTAVPVVVIAAPAARAAQVPDQTVSK